MPADGEGQRSGRASRTAIVTFTADPSGAVVSGNGSCASTYGVTTEAADVLVDAAAALADDPASADEALLAALRAAAWAGPAKIRKIASTMVPPARSAGSAPQATDLLVAGFQARYTKGYAAAVAPLRAALQALRADDLDARAGLECGQRTARHRRTSQIADRRN